MMQIQITCPVEIGTAGLNVLIEIFNLIDALIDDGTHVAVLFVQVLIDTMHVRTVLAIKRREVRFIARLGKWVVSAMINGVNHP